ncbi:restriction endonuclease subunit S [Aeromonas sp. R1-1]|uniref:restriction endonuclease subunit S n=1 Tax=Aeromonas sp. R1-1 TaxID=3138455 RepID=UPI0034A4F8E2
MFEKNIIGWKRKTLSELAVYINGFAFKPEDWNTQGLPIIRIAQITGSSKNFDYYDQNLGETYKISHGDLIFSWSGTLTVVEWKGGDAWLNQHLFKVIPKPGVSKRFLYHLLKFCIDEMDKRAHGSTMKHIKRGELNEFHVNVPDNIHEQQFISNILDSLESKVDTTKQTISKLQEIKAGLLHDLLTRGIGANGRLRPIFQQAPHLYKKSPQGWIPKEWSIGELDNALNTIEAGKSPSCPDIPAHTGEWGVLKVSAVHPDGFRAHENKIVEQTELQDQRYEVKSGDLLITRANTPELVGLPCLVHTDRERLMLSDKTLRLHVKEGYEKAFIFISLTQPYVRSQIQIAATGTSMSMKNISQSSLKRLNMKFPPHAEQVLIAERILDAGKRISDENALLKKMEQQKAGLMNDLLTGRVRVTELLNHQPPVQ